MLKYPVNLIKGITVLCLTCLVSACAVNQATGKRQFNVVSNDEEIKIGREADKGIRKEYGLYKDEKLSQYVTKVGKDLVEHSGRKDIPYYFAVLDSPEINAFALPGGYVYVTRGILAELNSEAELAFVLGHEISHVAAKHGSQRISQSKGIGVAMIAATLIFGAEEVNQYDDILSQITNLAVLGYGRESENEADRLGAIYALNAGYDIQEGSKFLHTLLGEEKKDPNFLEVLHRSHPPTKERIDHIRDLTATFAISPTKNYKVNQNEYLSQIDNLYIGPGSIAGRLIEDATYMNDAYGFKAKVIKHWTYHATLTQDIVSMSYDKQNTLGITQKMANMPPSTSEKSSSLSDTIKKYKTEDALTIYLTYEVTLDDLSLIVQANLKSKELEKDLDDWIYTIKKVDNKERQGGRIRITQQESGLTKTKWMYNQ